MKNNMKSNMKEELNKEGLEVASKLMLKNNNICREVAPHNIYQLDYCNEIMEAAIKAYLPYHDKQQAEQIKELEQEVEYCQIMIAQLKSLNKTKE